MKETTEGSQQTKNEIKKEVVYRDFQRERERTENWEEKKELQEKC